MPALVAPHPRYQRSFLEAVEEFLGAGDDERFTGLTTLPPVDGFAGEHFTAGELARPHRFEELARRLAAVADPATVLPDGVVHMTTLWWVEEDAYLGRLSIRHELTPWLRDFGGHIGYAVRPTARRLGHAGAMLVASLPVARGLGIDPALLTCDDTNTASRRVIEAAGGALEDQRGDKLRYWVPTHA